MRTDSQSAHSLRLIVHADDVGLCDSVNRASWAALESGAVSSASIMAVCPGATEAARYARRHPEMDWGVHLTLTSEWKALRWGPLADPNAVASLLAPDGHFWADTFSLARHAQPEHVEVELRAQIDRLLDAGVRLSHLDSHMFALFRTPSLRQVLGRVAQDYGLPHLDLPPPTSARPDVRVTPADPPRLLSPGLTKLAQDDGTALREFFQRLASARYQIIVHCGYDEPELRAITGSQILCGARWRQQEFDALMSDGYARALREAGITLDTWSTRPGGTFGTAHSWHA